MIRLLADENVNAHLWQALMQREAGLDLIHVKDVGLEATADSAILEWAAGQDRVLLTHDRQTVPAFAYARVNAGALMPGVFLVSDEMPIGQAVEEILLAIFCLSDEECRNVVKYFPM